MSFFEQPVCAAVLLVDQTGDKAAMVEPIHWRGIYLELELKRCRSTTVSYVCLCVKPLFIPNDIGAPVVRPHSPQRDINGVVVTDCA